MRRKVFIIGLIIIVIGLFSYFKIAQTNTNKVELAQNDEWAYSVDKEKRTITLTRYMGSQTNIEIPSTIQIGEIEYVVTTIGEGVFAENQSIESIKIPENVTKIGEKAFAGCTNLNKLVMPKSVSSIGENAFNGCESLDNINIANDENEEKIYEEEYIEYLQLSTEEKAKINVIPREEFVSIDALKENKEPIVGSSANSATEELPESYNLKDHINVTVENQGQSGWCWAYSSLKALDTNIALNYNLNYNSSEAHLAHMRSYYFGESLGLEDWTVDEIYNTGGNFYDFVSYAENRTVGPVLESQISNKKYSLTEANKTKLQQAEKYVRVLDTIYYPNITKEYQEDGTIIYKNGSKTCTEEEMVEFRNTIKKHIMEDGGVYTALDACPDSGTVYYNSSTAAYYWKGDKSQLTRDMGHAVTIVGWDDTYSKNNFKSGQRPANDGAYICLNSWGTSFGKSGYFYISYDDINVEQYLSGVTEAEEIPESIEITKLPDKTEFVQNYEELDLTGGEITITSKKGNKRVVSMLDDNVEVSGYSNKNTGELTLTVKYKYNNWEYWESQFNVNIIAATATKIEVSKLPTQLDYAKDCEQLDLTNGLLKITYNDNESWYKSINLASDTIEAIGFDNTVLGENIVTIKYEGQTTEFSVTITEIDSIEISTVPNKSIYLQDEANLSLKGGTIEISYTNGKSRTISTENTNIVATGFNTTELGEKEITLTYYTHNDKFKIKVVKNDFEYSAYGGKVTITKYTGSEAEVIVPDYLTYKDVEYPVMIIGSSAFSNCTSITDIELPNRLTTINYYAFSGCNSLKEITIPEKVTSIGDYVFRGCTNLVNINLLSGKAYIGDYAFQNCTSLKQITGVTNIGRQAFNGCSSLTDITMLESAESIGYFAFSGCTSLKNIVIPDNVWSIGEGAFARCSSLTSITIPEKITSIPYATFSGCSNLENIQLSNGLTSIELSAFSGCSSLTSIEIPDSVTSIGNSAFSKCSSLTSIEISDGLTSIGESAFAYCYNLTSIEIPNEVTSIGEDAFFQCNSLTSIKLGEQNNNYKLVNEVLFTKDGTQLIICPAKSGITTYEIPDTTTSIRKNAFSECSDLEEIIIPDSVSSMGEGVFRNCYSLRSIEIPEGVLTIEENTFYCCSNITAIEIPRSVTSIADRFYGCNNLTIYTYSDATEVINYAESKNIPYEIITNPLSSISITQQPNITEYKEGDKFNSEGMIVTAHYQDGTEANITNYSVIDGENLLEGQGNVTISYTEQARTRKAIQSIEVSAGVLESIQITTPPKKVDYIYGENFDATEMIITAIYENGSSKEIIDYTIEDGNNLAVGKSSITISYTENGVTKTVGQKITVSKAQGSISDIKDISKTYDGYEVNRPNFERVGDGEVTFEWYKLEGAVPEKLEEAPKNAGTYKVKVILLDGTNYKGAQAERTFTIGKATYDITGVSFEDASYTYDGMEKSIVISGTVPQGVSVSYEGNTGINVGEYTATVMFAGDSVNYNEIPNMTAILTIEKAEGSISNIQDLSKTYDKQAVAEPTYDKVGDGQAYVGWYKIENEQEMSLNEAPTNAGSYKVKVILAEGENYTGASAEKEFTISKAIYDMSEISFTDVTYAYDGTEKSIVISGTLPVGVSVRYENNTGINVGTYNAVAKFEGDSVNYNEILNMTATLTISAMQGSISNITDISKTYDGYQVNNPNFDRVGDGEISFEWYSIEGETETKLDSAPTNAGTYKVKVVMSATTNYTGAQAEKEFTISKAIYDMSGVEFNDATYTYDSNEKSIVINGMLPEGVSVRYENNTGTNAGEYNAVAIFTGDSTNYNTIVNKTAKLTIEKAQGNISSISDISKTYDGVEVSKPTCEGVGDGQVTAEWYSLEGENEIKLDTAPINAGNYKVKIILAEGQNYLGTTAERTFTINKANPAYTVPTGLTAIEGKKLSSVNLPEGFSWESELTTSVGDVGENRFTVTYTPQDTSNYNIVTGIEIIVTVIAKPEIDLGDYVEREDEETGEKYIENISQNTTVEEIQKEIDSNGKVEIYKGEDKVEGADTKIGTGMEVRITLENNQTISYKAVVKGDVTGDGEADISDLVLLARYVAKTDKNVENIKVRAMEVNNNDNANKVDMSDLVIMARYVARKINQL